MMTPTVTSDPVSLHHDRARRAASAACRAAGLFTALLLPGAGRSLAAQASGSIYVTARVVESPVSQRAVSVGLRMAAAPPISPRARRDLPGTTILVDTPRDTITSRPHSRITIIHW
jgi:hypothetical protein